MQLRPSITSSPRARRRLPAALAGTCLLAGAAVSPAVGAPVAPTAVTGLGTAATAAAAAANPCPNPFPVANLRRDQRVTGLTVDTGTTPKPFSGAVIGVLDDGIAPGIDMIMVELSSPAIDKVGGIWAGMSGSPVYAADGRLIGAVAYGLAFGASPVAGVTPAAAMYALRSSTAAAPTKVGLSSAAQQQLVASGAATAAEAAGGFERLPVPIGVSGASVRDLQRFAEIIDSRLDLSSAYATGSARAGGKTTPVVPGGNAAAALSYGDLTFAGVGTTTAVCGKQTLIFGHPFFYDGATTMSLHSADALYVQKDLITPFKVANPGGVVGTITQDRLAGLLGTVGAKPKTLPVTSTLRNVTTGGTRTGTTQAVTPAFHADIAALHTMANADRVLDSIGEGVARTTLTVQGTTPAGPWSLSLADVVASRFDVGYLTGFEVYLPLARILEYPRTTAKLTSVDVTGTLDERYQAIELDRAEVKVGNRWVPLGGRTLPRVPANKPIVVRITGYPWRSSTPVRRELTLPAQKPGFGFVEVRGGGAGDEFFFEEPATPPTFAALLTQLRNEPRGDDVLVTLDANRRTEAKGRMPQYVTGFIFGELEIG